jgi:ribokinase
VARVVVVGSCIVDRISRVDRFPRPGESRFAEVGPPLVGGKGFNQAVAASITGADVLFVGCVANDDDGDRFQNFLADRGMPMHGIMRSGRPTGQANVWVDSEGQNMICIDPGANQDLDPEWVKAFLVGEPLVLTQLETPDSCALTCVTERLILNPAPYRQVPPDLLRSAWLITPNEAEARDLTGRADAPPDELAEALLKLGPTNVIVTLGAEGCQFAASGVNKRYTTPRVNAMDTTGAGDVFNGVLAGLVAQGNGLQQSIPYASSAAAISTTRPGAAPSVPRWAEVESLAFAAN